jgi:hypothetical protein
MNKRDIAALERIYGRWSQGNFWEFESFDEVAIRGYSDRGRVVREVGLAT